MMLDAGGDPLAHRALESLLRAEASVRRRLSADLESEGLSASGFSVLIVLTTAGGTLELRALRRRLRTSKANATEVVGTLEARGLVARHRLEHDRRAAAVTLTPAGRGGRRADLPRAQRAGRARVRGPRRGREAVARRVVPQARRVSAAEAKAAAARRAARAPRRAHRRRACGRGRAARRARRRAAGRHGRRVRRDEDRAADAAAAGRAARARAGACCCPSCVGTWTSSGRRSSADALRPARLGLLEPAGPSLGLDAVREAELVLAPALAVDAAGRRLGQGGGSYDRALERAGAPVVAVVFDDEVLDEAIPVESHDRPVAGVLTPGGGLRWRRRGARLSAPTITRPRWRADPSIPSSPSPTSSSRCSSAGASATSSASRCAAARARRRGSSTRARRRPTAAPARTTSSRACSRTSTRASRRCAAIYVERKGGWDCHGLPVEIAVEQQLGIKIEGRDRGLRHRRVQREVPRVGLRVPRGLERADRADRLLGRPRRRLPHARHRPTSSRSGGRCARSGTRACSTRATRSSRTARAAARRCLARARARATEDVVDPSVYVRLPVAEDGGAAAGRRRAARVDDDAVDARVQRRGRGRPRAHLRAREGRAAERPCRARRGARRARARRGRADPRPLPRRGARRRALRAAVPVHPARASTASAATPSCSATSSPPTTAPASCTRRSRSARTTSASASSTASTSSTRCASTAPTTSASARTPGASSRTPTAT